MLGFVCVYGGQQLCDVELASSLNAHAAVLGSRYSRGLRMEPSCLCLAGLLTAVGAMQQAAHPPVMHLRDMNAYIASAFGDWAKADAPMPAVARVLGPMPECGSARAAGTSSFGMSGTNAFAIAALAGDAGSTARSAEWIWHRTR